jgi:class 3 adenylate cyclase
MAKAPKKPFDNIRTRATKMREQLSFSSEKLALAPNMYVAWLDVMGAGHLMSTSVQKSANFLARLHMAVAEACVITKFSGTVLPINDGMFLVTPSKPEIMAVTRHALAMLALNFVATHRQQDRFFVRCAIAFGPVYFGSDLVKGIARKSMRTQVAGLKNVAFGPPVIAAYKTESLAPPFGVAIHESARSFAPNGVAPFRMTHWLWWQNQNEIGLTKGLPPLPSLKDLLLIEMNLQFEWILETLLFNEVTKEKVEEWKNKAKQYFALA